jgi:hypothetical protein
MLSPGGAATLGLKLPPAASGDNFPYVFKGAPPPRHGGNRPLTVALEGAMKRGSRAPATDALDGRDQVQVIPARATGGRLRRSLHQACLRSRRPAAGSAQPYSPRRLA